MLHDPSHYEPPAIAEPISLADADKDILRKLAEELAGIAALPIHREKADLWRRLNDRQAVRPMVWINEIPWHEMDVDGELELRCVHPFARDQERELRRTIYQWRHLQCDMMIDMVERPDLVHAAVERMVDAWMVELDQFVALNALALDCNNTRIGSGGYGYVSDLPGRDFDASCVHPHNMWGCSNAQIFSEVSPKMHWEFALEHDLRWLRRWGLNYYGCCEPLDGKSDLLKRIPNLRKVSVTPWCKTERAVEMPGPHWVMSRKQNLAILAEDQWRPERARQGLRVFLEAARGCHIEIILKDISTVRRQPQRLWEWAHIAMEETEALAQ